LSQLERRLAAGELVVTSEMPTINSGGVEAVRAQLEPMAPYVDAVNATDNTAAHPHASPLAVAVALRGLGAEPIMQLTCRDRNRLALESEIVGAALHGIENISCLTGDDVSAGDEPEARRVFDLDSLQLIATARTLRAGRYLSGRPLAPPPPLFIGAVENPGAPPYEHRVERVAKKIAAGARFFQLQLCFETARVERFLAAAHGAGLSARAALLPSICILRSARSLRFIDAHVPGVSVPPATIARVEAAGNEEAACFDLAYELARHALGQPGVAGVHFISFRRDAGIAKLCTRLGIPPRVEREKHGHRLAIGV
jgi:methylenetetrahydrofolate reductase (NADPH)